MAEDKTLPNLSPLRFPHKAGSGFIHYRSIICRDLIRECFGLLLTKGHLRRPISSDLVAPLGAKDMAEGVSAFDKKIICCLRDSLPAYRAIVGYRFVAFTAIEGPRDVEGMMHWSDLFNSGASLFIVASASTKTMVPLRALAIAANCVMIAHFTVTHAWIPALLQVFALPLNAWRLYQMMALIGNVREAIRGKPSLDWLKPFMSERHYRRGDLLFARGETADEMFYTMTGRYVLVEIGIEIPAGHLVGELAMLAPDNRRTATLECIENGRVLSITYEQVEQLYYQNPTFGFYFLKLATARLFDNIGRVQAELEQRQAAVAVVL